MPANARNDAAFVVMALADVGSAWRFQYAAVHPAQRPVVLSQC
jgi:hypothetical protein